MSSSKTSKLMLCALFAALTGICSAISIPLPFTPVPVSLATLAVLLTGGLLGPKYGTISQLVYLILGAAGVPVFHNFTGGLGILVGPTGGYLIGYVAMAFVTGLLIHVFSRKKGGEPNFPIVAVAAFIATAALYAFGTIWFMFLTGNGLAAALLMCVVPFLPGDLLKVIAASLLTCRLCRHLPA